MFKRLQRWLFAGRPKTPPKHNYFISTASETLERIQRLGLSTSSQTMPGE